MATSIQRDVRFVHISSLVGLKHFTDPIASILKTSEKQLTGQLARRTTPYSEIAETLEQSV